MEQKFKFYDLSVIIILIVFMCVSSIVSLVATKKSEEKIGKRLEEISSKSDAQTKEINLRLDSVQGQVTGLGERLDEANQEQENFREQMDKTFDNIYNRLHDTNEHLKEVEIMKQEQKERQRQAVIQASVDYSAGYNLPTTGLTKSGGVNNHNGHKETYYNLPMGGVIQMAYDRGLEGEYWVRDDGVKMFGDYVIVAGSQDKRDTIVDTSLGQGIVLDTGSFAYDNPEQYDIATDW